MPIWTYKCYEGHETERIYLSINEEPLYYTPCDTCQLTAERVAFEQTAPPNLPGEGFFSPSKGGPIHNKSDSAKAWQELKQRKLIND
jgi:hypothetical protein